MTQLQNFHRSALIPWIVLLAAVALLAAACGGDDDDTATPVASPSAAATTATSTTVTASPTATVAGRLKGVPGIVDPSNLGWPRVVEGLNGKVSIEKKPARIHTMSAGFDEITVALVPVSRIVAVGTSTKDPNTTSMADKVKDLPGIAREPEAIAKYSPDIVVASPTQKADVIDAIKRLQIPVVQVELDQTPKGRLDTILLLGYIYGEEERAIKLADEVSERYEAVIKYTDTIAESKRPLVLSALKFTTLTVGGKGTTAEGIIRAAGGRSAASEIGMEGNAQTSLEGIVATNPDVIILPSRGDEGNAFRDEIMKSAALASLPAVVNKRVYVVPLALFATNSFASVRAVEYLAHLLYPDKFPQADPPQFSFPSGN
ncbi:MAG: ABC transporter substrate-binding protein [Dehalococcoidia bacterium]|nr:ABC transporter substrate-binding protein [Dehalococcoidia bacterium]